LVSAAGGIYSDSASSVREAQLSRRESHL
jgi:hypothetical protein